MYVPSHFAETDIGALHEIMRAHNFATLVSVVDGTPFATHLPFLLDPGPGPYGTLHAHMARANPHWRGFAGGGEAMVVFQGPHGYVSPSWYATREKVVPTWNYLVVHAYGVPELIADAVAVRAHLERLLAVHESAMDHPWSLAGQPADFVAAMLKGVVGFEMPLTRLEGKAKLSQNRPAADRAGAIAGLSASGDPLALALAAAMTARDR